MKKLFFLSYFFLFLAPVTAQEIIGPANNVRAIRSISPNGRYAVGQTPVSRAFFWDSAEGNDVYVFPEAGEAFDVTDSKLTAGTFDDPNHLVDGKAIRSGGYSTDGKTWNGLGLGLLPSPATGSDDGSSIRGVTADGSKIAGSSGKNTPQRRIIAPCVWSKNGNAWEAEGWAHPDNIRYASIFSIADDGNTAVGYVTIIGGPGRSAILWKSPTEYELPFDGSSEYTEYICISPNGKYAAYRRSATPGVHNLETNKKTSVSQGIIINGISNTGLAVGEYDQGGTKGFIWSEELGFMSFQSFIATYAPEFMVTGTPLGDRFAEICNGDYSLRDITPDGRTIAIQLPRASQAYLLKLPDITLVPYPEPENVTATVSVPERNRVTLTWTAPKPGPKTLTGYVVFRDETEIARLAPGILTCTDTDVPGGYHNYTVKAIYGTAYSQPSNIAAAVVAPTYDLPLNENFASGSIETNCWEKETEAGKEYDTDWTCDRIGADNDFTGLVFSAGNSIGAYDASLVSRYMDGSKTGNVYVSFLTKSNYNLSDNTIVPDSLWLDVYDGMRWTTVWKSVYKLTMEWNMEIVDLSPAAAGKLFKVRFRIKGVNNTTNAKYLFFDDINISTALPDGDATPCNLRVRKENGRVQLVWQDPSSETYTLTYARSSAKSMIGNEGVNFIAANRFDSGELRIYEDLYLNAVSVYIVRLAPEKELRLRLAVFDNDTRIATQDVSGFVDNAWNTFTLNEPVALKDRNLKFGIEVVQHDAAEMPVGIDGSHNPATGRGDLYSEDGGATWQTLTDARQRHNWCIIGNVSTAGHQSNGRNLDVIGYNVYKDGIKVNDDLIFSQSLVTGDPVGTCYTLRAYSATSGISEASEAKCITKDVPIHSPRPDGIRVYSDRDSNGLRIESDAAVRSISVYDSAGSLVKQLHRPATPLSLKGLGKGLYIIKIRTEEGISIHKIIQS